MDIGANSIDESADFEKYHHSCSGRHTRLSTIQNNKQLDVATLALCSEF